MTGTARRILVVDDEEDIRLLSEFMLQPDGHIVETASDCASAIEQIENNAYDLVLLDVGLPDGSGLDLLRRLKETGIVPDLPVVIVSAYGMGVVKDELDDLCAVGYLRKPYDANELRHEVRRVFEIVTP